MKRKLLTAAAVAMIALAGCAARMAEPENTAATAKSGGFAVDTFRRDLLEAFIRTETVDDGRDYFDRRLSDVEIRDGKAVIIFRPEEHPEGIYFAVSGIDSRSGKGDTLVYSFSVDKEDGVQNPFLYPMCLHAVLEMTQPGEFETFYREYAESLANAEEQHEKTDSRPDELTVEILGTEWIYTTHIVNDCESGLFSFIASPAKR